MITSCECGTKVVILDKKDNRNYYHSQRNNKINPYGACNITCLNMIFDYLGLDYTDDQVMEMTRSWEIKGYYKKHLLGVFGSWFLKKKKLNLIWKVLEKVANIVFKKHNLKYRAKFVSDISTIWHYLEKTIVPVMLSTTFTKSGHIVIVTGYIRNIYGLTTHYIINDPYGNPLLKYSDGNGRMVRVPTEWFLKKVKYDRGLIFEKTN